MSVSVNIKTFTPNTSDFITFFQQLMQNWKKQDMHSKIFWYCIWIISHSKWYKYDKENWDNYFARLQMGWMSRNPYGSTVPNARAISRKNGYCWLILFHADGYVLLVYALFHILEDVCLNSGIGSFILCFKSNSRYIQATLSHWYGGISCTAHFCILDALP